MPTPNGKYFRATKDPSRQISGRNSLEKSNLDVTPASTGFVRARTTQIGTAIRTTISPIRSARGVYLIMGRKIHRLATMGIGTSAIPIRDHVKMTANAQIATKKAELESTIAALCGIVRSVAQVQASSGPVIKATRNKSAVALGLAWKPANAGVTKPYRCNGLSSPAEYCNAPKTSVASAINATARIRVTCPLLSNALVIVSKSSGGPSDNSELRVRAGARDQARQSDCSPISASASYSIFRPGSACHRNGGNGTNCNKGITAIMIAMTHAVRGTSRGLGDRSAPNDHKAAVSPAKVSRIISGYGFGEPPPPSARAAARNKAASRPPDWGTDCS